MCLPVKPYAILKEWDRAGLKCAVTQAHNAGGYMCGYVRVPPGHLLYGVNHENLPYEISGSVHGGINLTVAEPCAHEDGSGWWMGFDCGHSLTDLMQDPNVELEWLKDLPEGEARDRVKKIFTDEDAYSKIPWVRRRHYWSQPEVEAETNRLAELAYHIEGLRRVAKIPDSSLDSKLA